MIEKRKTRGVRVTELDGSDAEKDEEFWNHDTWEDGSEDEEGGGGDAYSTEEERPDQFDSDFNESESDDDGDSGAEEDSLRKAERKKTRAGQKRNTLYREPAPKKKKKLATVTKDGEARPKAPRHKGSAPADYTPRSLRGSTQCKTRISQTSRQVAKQLSTSKAPAKTTKERVHFTQEELLMEAIETERENTRWILSMQRLAREKESQRSRNGPRQNLAAIQFLSRKGSTTVTFREVEAQPPFFR